MNVLAHDVPVSPSWRLGQWAAAAWQRLSWRHLLLALLVEIVRDSIHPLGGVFFPPMELPGWDPVARFFDGRWIVSGLFIIYCVLVADEAFDGGASPLRAYGSVVLALAVCIPLADRLYVDVLARLRLVNDPAGFTEGLAQILWWSQAAFYESAFGLSIYGYWRVTQRAMRRAQAAETERARNEQRVQTSRLLALQSRVEPQMLFDALHRVRKLHGDDPHAADALLADLIALLRAMQPGAKTDTSSVEREFALVAAWLRVTRSVGGDDTVVELAIAPDARPVGIAPMLVLPLLRTVLALPCAGRCGWSLSAGVTGQRLLVVLKAAPEAAVDEQAWAGVDLASLHGQLAQLFGRSARLTVSLRPPSVTLDLPRLQEEHDDDSVDR